MFGGLLFLPKRDVAEVTSPTLDCASLTRRCTRAHPVQAGTAETVSLIGDRPGSWQRAGSSFALGKRAGC